MLIQEGLMQAGDITTAALASIIIITVIQPTNIRTGYALMIIKIIRITLLLY